LVYMGINPGHPVCPDVRMSLDCSKFIVPY
jgi:hypothetical protein